MKTPDKWISVEEGLPKNGSMSICRTLIWYDILQFDAKRGQWFGPHSIHGKEFVTHWMPLPEPPKED